MFKSFKREVSVKHGTTRGIKRSNVKHQRARATASRENGTISLRALRCMR
jgi:hypothetical protein